MATPLIVPHQHVSHCAHCDIAIQDPYIDRLKLICCVAFGAFAAYKVPTVFALSVLVGVVYQVVLTAKSVKTPPPTFNSGSCGQGNGEVLSGRGLLPTEIIVAWAYTFFEHVEHNPVFFGRMIGFYLGIQIAYTAENFLRTHNDAKVHSDTSVLKTA
jgi:hypothetical protein